jgi:hypothetical protein
VSTDPMGKLSRTAGIVYCPAKGVPKRPTASSTQMRKSAIRIAPQIAILWFFFFTFLITSSPIRPVLSSRMPATTKSNRVQFTSSVNSIAINGMSNRSTIVNTMPISLLFCVIIIFLFCFNTLPVVLALKIL